MIPAFLSGVWGYVLAFGFGVALATGSTYEIVHNANAVEIGSLKLATSQQQTISVTASLDQLQKFIASASIADHDYGDAVALIQKQYAALSQGLKNATAKPLPVDCKPDAGRVHALAAAIAAANADTSTAK